MSNSKNSKAIAVIIVLVVVLLGVCTAFAVFAIRVHDTGTNVGGNMVEEETKQRKYLVTEDNVEEVEEELQTNPTDASYNVTMNVNWTCSSDTYELKNAYIANSTANNRTMYFNIIQPETEEVLYSSPFITVGQELRGFTLEQGLPTGQNLVWVEYHLVDEDEKELSTVTVTANITVK